MCRPVFILFCCTILVITACAEAFCSDKTAGFILTDDKGKILSAQNEEVLYTPASILKILTSLAAIHQFKKNYRFQTHYYFNPDSRDLYIKGFGDPLFISETIESLVRSIASKIQTKSIRHIICDTSFFSRDIVIPGKGYSLNPYDSTVGALCANFNTINFMWDDAGKQFVSAEPQTPLLSIFEKKIKQTRLNQGRIVLSVKESRLYAGLLIQYFLNKQGVSTTGKVLDGNMPNLNKGIHIFRSPYTLIEVVQKLLEFSNNFMANQLLLSMGSFVYGPPATLEKGLLAVKDYSAKSLGMEHLQISEGSGISRKNGLTPVQMMTVLHSFRPYYRLLKQDQNDFYKTGTLSGVRTRAGFLVGPDKRFYPYVIMVNEKKSGYRRILKNFNQKIAQSVVKNTT